MSKRAVKNSSTMEEAKKYGRSYGGLVTDKVIGDTVTQKILNSRIKNNPKKYA